MDDTTAYQPDPDGTFARMVAENQGDLGQSFKVILGQLKTWREGRVLGFFCRLQAYRDNDVKRLLDFAADLKAAHAAQIRFYEEYKGELFNFPDVAAREFEETKFMEEVMVPLLRRLADQRVAKKASKA